MKKVIVLLFALLMSYIIQAQDAVQNSSSTSLLEDIRIYHYNLSTRNNFYNNLDYRLNAAEILQDISYPDKCMDQTDKIPYRYYKPEIDTIKSDSLNKDNSDGQNEKDKPAYKPFKHALSILIIPGLEFNGGGIGYSGKLMICYHFNPNVSLGIGAGYTNYSTHIKSSGRTLGTWTYFEYKTDKFLLSCVPVYINFSFDLSKKRLTPFLSFNLGLSFPTTTNVNGTAVYNGLDGDYNVDLYSGPYFALEGGMKLYSNEIIDAGLSLGMDASVIRYNGWIVKENEADNQISVGFFVGLRIQFYIFNTY